MPLSESTQASIALMWLMVIGAVVCILEKSYWGFAFLFVFLWVFCGLVKRLVDPKHEDRLKEGDADVELQPLGKISKDMTLGEVLARY